MNLRQRDMAFSRPGSRSITDFMNRVYAWMTLGIFITGIVSYTVGNNAELAASIFQNQLLFWMLIIVQFGAVIFLSTMINRISVAAAAITFLMYSALTGLTLSMIFLLYTQQSIATAFATTACGFAGLSVFGYTTKRDLGPIGSFCMMGLFGLIALMILAIFIPSLSSNSMQITFSVAGLVIFAGLTAYDTQRIKALANLSGNTQGQQAIYGALVLYLDFINLFLNLMRLMGDRR